MKTAKKLTGAAIAAAATTLLMSGCASYTPSAGATKSAQVHCLGVNSCKGTSGCATASNACKGQNSCKGQGWLSMSASECASKGGTET